MNQATRSSIAGLCISASCLVGIASHEGYVGHTYIPLKGDVPTIGFGHTVAKPNQTTTPVRALLQLLEDVNKASLGLKQCISAPLTQYEFDAYSSLALNVGASKVCNSSIPNKLNNGQYEEACNTILDFDHYHGRENASLKKRRIDEWRLCRGMS